jgi:hypothetical protein
MDNEVCERIRKGGGVDPWMWVTLLPVEATTWVILRMLVSVVRARGTE